MRLGDPAQGRPRRGEALEAGAVGASSGQGCSSRHGGSRRPVSGSAAREIPGGTRQAGRSLGSELEGGRAAPARPVTAAPSQAA